MSLLTEKKFSFTSSAAGLTEDTFTVIQFKGYEAISKPYEFEIMLVSDNLNIDLGDVLRNPAKFTIHRDNGDDVDFNGILSRFEELREFNGYVFFRAHLVPKLWWLSLTHHNQVCLDNSIPEIIENTLKDGGLFQNLDFDFNVQDHYSKIDYVCQYGETHFNFISRWAEREGIYYFFEQTEKGEKILFTDTKISHSDLPQEITLYYAPPSGLDSQHLSEAIKVFTCRYQMLPKRVFLKDYNYIRPSLGIDGSAVVDENGRGEKYIYGEHFATPEEGNRLAAIRAEELLCRKVEFFGESSVPFMMPGYIFNMEDHYRDAFNSRYLITHVMHEGHQTGFLYSGIVESLSETEQRMVYENRFTAIPADVQFRPERKSAKPNVSGTIHARVDAEGDGQYAELDDLGRYKIKLPFDVNDTHKDGKASAHVRMMQPYAGEEMGMHFPLHKGTEVLLTFIDGDPDRPVIAGAIPNPETASPVNVANQSESVIRTGGDNKIRIEDMAGTERIIMQSPKVNSFVRIGTPNDPNDYIITPGQSVYVEKDNALPANWNSYSVKPPYTEDAGLTNNADATGETVGSEKIKVNVTNTANTAVPGEYAITYMVTVFKVDDSTGSLLWLQQKQESKTRKLYVTEAHHLDIQEGDGIKVKTDGGLEMYTGDPGMAITAANPQDINIGTENGHINIQTKDGSLKNVNMNAYNIDSNCRGSFWDVVCDNQNSFVGGNSTEFGVGNNLSIKGGTDNSIFVGSAAELGIGSKAEFFFGSQFETGLASKYENYWGPEYDAGWDDWKKHSNKRITIDAQGKIELIGGNQNNSKFTGTANELKVEFGQYQESIADNPWKKAAKYGIPTLLTHLVMASAASFITIPLHHDKKENIAVDTGLGIGTAATAALAAAITLILFKAFKKSADIQPVAEITHAKIHMNNQRMTLSSGGTNIEVNKNGDINLNTNNHNIYLNPGNNGTIQLGTGGTTIKRASGTFLGCLKVTR